MQYFTAIDSKIKVPKNFLYLYIYIVYTDWHAFIYFVYTSINNRLFLLKKT